jgi:hypothetical protein
MENAPAQPNETPERPEQPEGLLYHYTDEIGLRGIISSGCMWATHYKFLNDLSERQHGFAIFCRAIDDLIQENRFIGVFT